MKNRLLLLITGLFLLAGVALWWGHRHPHQISQTSNNQSKSTSNQNPDSKKPQFDKSKYSVDEAGSIWWVVNKKRPLNPIQYVPPDLVAVGNGQSTRSEAAKALASMIIDAKAAGYTLLAESGYRSYATQVTVYNSEIRRFGQAKADTESARPGYSEHQTGWAVDIQTPGCLEDCFSKSAAASWLQTHSFSYGFIVRYQEDKEVITGYRAEPWHVRFVGRDLAIELHRVGQTMEEFFELPNVGYP